MNHKIIVEDGDEVTIETSGGLSLTLKIEAQPGEVLPGWAFPVGAIPAPDGGIEGTLNPCGWYAASLHGTDHAGLDLNLDKEPWGDVDRGLPVYAISDGVVFYTTENWGGVPMCVVVHWHDGKSLYTRYAHVDLNVGVGDVVGAGDVIGWIADWKTGDHLHFDMAYTAYTREYLNGTRIWVDPVPILKQHLDPNVVDCMLRRGG